MGIPTIRLVHQDRPEYNSLDRRRVELVASNLVSASDTRPIVSNLVGDGITFLALLERQHSLGIAAGVCSWGTERDRREGYVLRQQGADGAGIVFPAQSFAIWRTRFVFLSLLVGFVLTRSALPDVEPTVEAVPAEAIESSAASTPFHSPKADDIAVFPSSTLLPSLLPALGLLNFNSVAPSPHMQSTNSASGLPQSPQQSMESTEGLRLHMQLQANEAARLQQHSQFLQFQAESQGQMELDANHHHLASLQSQATHQYVPPPAELVAQALQQAHFDRSRTDYAPMMMDHPLLSNTGGTPSLAPTMTMADSQQLSDFALSLPNSFVSQQ